jgi:hypothetical protein
MFTYLFRNPLRKHWDIIDPFLTSSDSSYNGGFQETPELFLTIKPEQQRPPS